MSKPSVPGGNRLLLLITSWILYVAVWTKQPVMLQKKPNESPDDEKMPFNASIDIATMVVGPDFLPRLFPLIKNILYYEGRVRYWMTNCALNIGTINAHNCPEQQIKPSTHLNFHLLTDARSKIIVQNYFQDMQIKDFTLHLYDFESVVHILDVIPDELYNGNPRKWRNIWAAWLRKCRKKTKIKTAGRNRTTWTTLRIAWPEILPENVSKVITIDTDVLINQDIWNLWKHFYRFNSTQMLGGIFELTDYLKGRMDSPEQPMLGNGFNGGVLLMDLRKMRQQNWAELWRKAVANIAETDKFIAFSDQKIFNVIMYRNRHFFYELPCEWNIVIGHGTPAAVCPVAWVVGIHNRRNCLIPRQSALRLIGLAHYTAKPKPGDLAGRNLRRAILVKTVQTFRDRDLHITFNEVYYAFDGMDKHCFG
ncbi:unnamed protein product [Calicophoron daubneyi]|uniref:Uncharacterized protein n=1 Tax=Calicophoron daubneyi TaxID=300641 RepID=A0AAV2T2R8_CALDB